MVAYLIFRRFRSSSPTDHLPRDHEERDLMKMRDKNEKVEAEMLSCVKICPERRKGVKSGGGRDSIYSSSLLGLSAWTSTAERSVPVCLSLSLR